MVSQAHRQLMQYLNKRVKQERWQKLPKKQGKILNVSTTKSGNLKLELPNIDCYVLKRNKNLFATASSLKKGEVVSIALRTYLGKYYVLKITKKGQSLDSWI